MNVVVDGLLANYQKSGTGRAIILIHGWGDSLKTYLQLAEQLEAGYEVYALDLPGFGGSQVPESVWDTDDYVRFVKAFIKKLGIKPLAVVGHSFGGAIAIKMAADNPGFSKLVLLASAGVRNRRPLRRGLLKAAAKAAKLPLYLAPAGQRDRLKRKAYSSIGSDAMLLPHMEKIYRRIITQDVREAAGRIKLPVLLIYGSTDRLTPPADGQILHRLIANSKLELLGAGHTLHQEQAEHTAELIKQFLTDKG